MFKNKSSKKLILYNSSSNFDEINACYQSKVSLNDSIKFYYEDGKRLKKIRNRYFICHYCHSSPKFTFIDNKLHVKCDCKKLDELIISDFIEKYTTHNKYVIERYLYCNKHNKKYERYCKWCRVNLCEDCINENQHKNHYPDNLLDDDINKKILEIEDLIKDIRTKVTNGDIENRKILNIIRNLIKSYKEYPSHNLYKTITEFSKYLESIKIPQVKRQIKIRTIDELLDENIFEISQYITSIKIKEQNFNDLSILSDLDLRNLKKLALIGNNIKNIEPLLKINFEKLQYLDLENNKLSDETFKNFGKMKLKDIRYINLFKNEIRSPRIFETLKKFPTLKTFFIGKNLFDEKEINNNMHKTYDLNQLKKIGLSGNFTDKTINFISNLKLANLKEIYLSWNKLSSYEFLKNLDSENLVLFWAVDNNVKDYKDILNLKHKEKIEEITIKENKISNIDDLSDFIDQFPKLKLFNISDNPIDLDDPKNQEIINQIKNKYRNCKFYFKEEN